MKLLWLANGSSGHPINAAQWVLNIISIILLPFFLYALLSVRRQNPLPVVAYSYVYLLDMLANIAFTIFFSVTWFRGFDKVVASGDDDANAAKLDTASERGVSISVIVLVLLFRLYSCFVLFGYARMLVRKSGLRFDNGQGKSAMLQYVLLGLTPSFWRRGGRRAGKGRMVTTLEESGF